MNVKGGSYENGNYFNSGWIETTSTSLQRYYDLPEDEYITVTVKGDFEQLPHTAVFYND